FLNKVLLFLMLVLAALLYSLFFLPDKAAQESVLSSIKTKHVLLQKITSPKIIFTGGSNVSFGLDSKTITDSLKMPVVNTAIHGGLGLEFMMNNVKPYFHKGDVVVLIPEYENFYTDNFYGEMELVSLLFDIEPQERASVDATQWIRLAKYILPYSAKKIKNRFTELLQKEKVSEEIDIYAKQSFNQYGDTYIHWMLPNQSFTPIKIAMNEKVKHEVISFIKEFKTYVEKQQAMLILLPPVMEENSYVNLQDIINNISMELKKNEIAYYSAPLRYKFTAGYFFNTYYHTNKQGVDLRTKLIIEDLKSAIKK
ncbi:MAG TPA: hypothetical protein VF411_13075, partial [Bacteroidia bacterium]